MRDNAMLDVPFIYIANIVFNFYNILICLFIIFALFPSIIKNDKAALYFSITCFFTILFNLGDIPNWCCEGPGKYNHTLLLVGTVIYYLSHPFIFWFYLEYMKEYLPQKKIIKFFIKIFMLFLIVYSILTLLSIKYNLFFYITPDNYYKRGNFYSVSVGLIGVFFFMTFMILVANHKYLPNVQKISFYSFFIIPFVLEIVQILNYGLSLVNMGITFSMLIIFINLHRNLEIKLYMTESQIRKKQELISEFQENTILSLSNLVENRDTDKGNHIQRIVKYIEILAKQAQKDHVYPDIIDAKYISILLKAAPLHDIGKIVVPDKILKKEGKLDTQEFEQMKRHVIEAEIIVKDVIGFTNNKEYIDFITDIATYHHERWDGRGYPYNLSGTQIPLCARLMAIVDVFDAIVTNRYYKTAVPFETAIQDIENNSGKAFDPILVTEFLKVTDDINKVLKTYGE